MSKRQLKQAVLTWLGAISLTVGFLGVKATPALGSLSFDVAARNADGTAAVAAEGEVQGREEREREMKRKRRLVRTLLVFTILMSVSLVSCGSDSTSSSSTPAAPDETAAESAPSKPPEAAGAESGSQRTRTDRQPKKREEASEPAFAPVPHHDSGGGSRQFRTKGGDNSIQEYGSEPSSAEFNQAAAVLHTYLDARVAGAWKAACQQLAPVVAKQLVRQFGATEDTRNCAKVIAELSYGVPASALREAARADVGALRAEGNSGFLLFQGAHGARFFIPMRRTGGEWKVAAIASSPLE